MRVKYWTVRIRVLRKHVLRIRVLRGKEREEHERGIVIAIQTLHTHTAVVNQWSRKKIDGGIYKSRHECLHEKLCSGSE